MRKIEFYISGAGLSGDSMKLLCGTDTETGMVYLEMFDENWIWSLKKAKKKIIKKIKALEPEYINKS